LLSPHDKLKNASFLGAFLFIRLKKPMTIITKADKKVGCGVWGVGCGVWGVGCGVWGVGCGVWG